MTSGLTSTQREALEWLKAKRDAYPHLSHGFNPPRGRSRLQQSMRRALADRGLVTVTRVSDSHFRYDITDAGRAALVGKLADANQNQAQKEQG